MDTKRFWRFIKGNHGVTILELIVALFLTAVITAAMFRFYLTVHQQSLTQYDVSELHSLCRASMYDIQREVRMAGYRIGTHPPLEISGDTLSIYYKGINPVDTVMFYLVEYDSAAYSSMSNLPPGVTVHYLVKKVNSDPAEIFADNIESISFTLMGTKGIDISICAISPKPDETYADNNGYHMYSMDDCANMRNPSLL